MHSRSPHSLIAFHHAGGSSATFISWHRQLAPHIRLVPVTLPHQVHSDSCTLREIESLVARLNEQIVPWTSAPYTIYGHSMGATVGLAVSLYRVANHLPGPRALLVGAAAAPDSPIDSRTVRAIADADRTTTSDIDSPVAGIKRRQLHADLRILDALRSYCVSTFQSPADFPIRVFVGTRDPLSRPDTAKKWSKYTSASCASETVEGDHYFHRDPGFVARIRRLCSDSAVAAR